MHRKIVPIYRRVTLATMVLAISVLPIQASAAGFAEPEEITNRQKAHLNIIFTGSGSEENKTACEEISTANLSGGSNLEKIYNYFIGKGLKPEQAAGVVGNIDVESSGNPQNAQVGPDTKDPSQFGTGVGVGKAWGLIQWDAGGRVIDYAKQARAEGPIYELTTQLDVIWWHMNNLSPTSSTNMFAQYKNISDVAEAATVFHDRMEGSSDSSMNTRIERAREALRRYGAGAASPSDTAISECDETGGGVASANGFTFPLKTTQKAIKNNGNGKWCYESQGNCHHDYNAADLMITTGTEVVAAKPGRVVSVHSGNQHPNNITIRSDDGKGINYYTHMGANTVKLRVGAKVAGGDKLGNVGTSEDAMGTGPHLHFDMLPPSYPYRPSCSGSSCSGLPFFNVQPALIETFKKLPES